MGNKNGGKTMKKFLWFIVVAIAVVSFGLTIYYFSADNEVIYVRSSYLVVEEGEYISTNSLLEFKNRGKDTTLSFSSGNEEILSFESEGSSFEAKKGGQSQIVVKTSNKRYSTFVIDVLVCDGSAEYPFVITTESALKKIGDNTIENNKYTVDKNYRLGADIALEEVEEGNWTPIANFSGMFDGNFYTISNVHITDQTVGENTNSVGFFANTTSSAVVKNLVLSNLKIELTKGAFVGSVAGTNQGIIQTTLVNGSIKVDAYDTTSMIGGVVGIAERSNTADSVMPKIDRCGFEGSISLPHDGSKNVAEYGGIVGRLGNAQLSESYFRATGLGVQNYENNFGGIVGCIVYGEANGDARAYDNYAYFASENTENIDYTKIAGLIAKNLETRQDVVSKRILGNYFGGNENLTQAVVEGTGVNSINNKYLTNEEFSNQENFITYKSATGEEDRLWNFYSVWEYTDGYIYPVLNIFSSVGSTYLDDPDIVTGDSVLTADELYEALTGTGKYADAEGIDIQGTYDAESAHNILDMNPEVIGWTWGDENHPIPAMFDKTLRSSTNCIIKNLVITNTDTTATENVGLVKVLGSNAVVRDLVFDKVKITGNPAQFVGVLCGEDKGASIAHIVIQDVTVELSTGLIPASSWTGIDITQGWQNVTTVRTINASGRAFGTIAGRAYASETKGIQYVEISLVDFGGSYFLYGGGVVGYNSAIITKGLRSNSVNTIRLNATYAGGFVGNNFGKVEYASADNVEFKQHITDSNKNTLFKTNLFVGGIAGTNNGDIANSYVAYFTTDIQTGSNFYVSIGGVAGANNGAINNTKVTLPVIKTTGKYYAMAGGLVGKNSTIANGNSTNGTIVNSTVSGGTIALEFATNGQSARNNKDVSIIATGSMAGGLVGFDDRTSVAYSIKNCSTTMAKISGFFAGGISGLSYGKVSNVSVGDPTNLEAKTEITGFHAGGFSAGIADGFIKNSYVIATVKTCSTTGSYNGVSSIVNMEVSASAGYAVIISNNAQLAGNYAVVTFGGEGVSFSTTADLEGKYVGGKFTGNIYQESGAVTAPNIGTKLTQEQITGIGGDFSNFTRNIGCKGNAHDIWNLIAGQYPTLR